MWDVVVYLPFRTSVHTAEVLSVIVERAAYATNDGQISVEGLHVALPFCCFQSIHAYLNLCWHEAAMALR